MQAHVIGIVGGSGGVGATVLCAAVSVRAAAAGRVPVVVDGDRLGGGIDVTLGLEQEPGLRWPDVSSSRGRVDGAELMRRLPQVDGVAALSFDRARRCDLSPEPLTEVVTALAGIADVLAVDLPSPDDPLFRPLTALVDTVVLVAGQGVRALAAASALAPVVASAAADTWLCLRTPGDDLDLAESVSAALDLPLVAVLRDESSLDSDLLHGIPPGSHARGPLAHAADRVLVQALAGREPWAS